MTGCLTAIGTGPGDPELLTLKAVRRLEAADLVAFVHAAGRVARARTTVAAHLRPGTTELAVALDMGPDRTAVDAAYDRMAIELRQGLARGQRIVVLCEGDPLLFGSFVHLLPRLEGLQVEIVPGIASPQAAAAAARWVLATADGAYAILPATMGTGRLRHRLALVEAAAIVKVGRHLEAVRRLLHDLGLLDTAWLTLEVSTADEQLVPLADWPAATAPYFGLVLTRGLGGARA